LIGPVRKSHGGAGESHGTVRSRGQTPGAAAMNPWSTVRGGPRDDETRGGKWRNGRWVRRAERRRHPRTRAKLRRAICESHERHRDFDGPGQVAITARSASLVREPCKEPATNDPRGRRLHSAKMKAPETRGAKIRMGELKLLAWVPGPEQRRSGMVRSLVTSDGTARPANAEGNRRNLTRGAWPICPCSERGR